MFSGFSIMCLKMPRWLCSAEFSEGSMGPPEAGMADSESGMLHSKDSNAILEGQGWQHVLEGDITPSDGDILFSRVAFYIKGETWGQQSGSSLLVAIQTLSVTCSPCPNSFIHTLYWLDFTRISIQSKNSHSLPVSKKYWKHNLHVQIHLVKYPLHRLCFRT